MAVAKNSSNSLLLIIHSPIISNSIPHSSNRRLVLTVLYCATIKTQQSTTKDKKMNSCNNNCNQGRDCICDIDKQETNLIVGILIDLVLAVAGAMCITASLAYYMGFSL